MTEPALITFDAVEPVEEGPGVRTRAVEAAGRRFALVEYDPGAGRDAWCRDGHHAYIVVGAIHYEFEDGREPVGAVAGQGLYLPAGIGHKGRNHHFERTRLFVVDDPR
jgi:uncharacterized RmlC-like cupin family protein